MNHEPINPEFVQRLYAERDAARVECDRLAAENTHLRNGVWAYLHSERNRPASHTEPRGGDWWKNPERARAVKAWNAIPAELRRELLRMDGPLPIPQAAE